MLSALHRRARTPGRGQRGAVAVEAALITPVLVTLVFGIIEFSFVMRDYVSVTSATRSGARIASTGAGAGVQVCDAGESGTQCSNAAAPELAKLAANAIQNQGTALNKGQINYLLVYKANAKGLPGALTTWGADPRTDCKNALNCVVYTWSPTAMSGAGKFQYNPTYGSWTSSTVNSCVASADSVGVYLNTTHPYITKLFGSSIGISDRTTMKFEPLTADVCGAGKHP